VAPDVFELSHPCALDPGNPCRDDGVSQALVYNDECSGVGTQAEPLQRFGTQSVHHGIPTETVGTI